MEPSRVSFVFANAQPITCQVAPVAEKYFEEPVIAWEVDDRLDHAGEMICCQLEEKRVHSFVLANAEALQPTTTRITPVADNLFEEPVMSLEPHGPIKAQGSFTFETSYSSLGLTEIRSQLQEARIHGQRRLRRLRGPTLLLGSILVLGGSLLFLLLRLSATTALVAFGLNQTMVFVGAVVLGFSVLPSDGRVIYILASCFCTLGLVVIVPLVQEILRVAQPLNDCNSNCWAVKIRIGTEIWFLFLIVSLEFCIIVCLALRLSSVKLLKRLWVLARIFFANMAGVNLLNSSAQGIIGAHALMVGYGQAAMASGLLCLACRSQNVHRVQSWLMSRGEAATLAAGISSLLADREVEQVLNMARNSFRSISAEKLSQEDMSKSTPDARLSALSEDSLLGQVDAFVSHSWSDDPSLKWSSLQRWRDEFKLHHDGREPKLWIDKYCIDQSRIEDSLACLPVFLSGCRKLVVFCGKTYLQRLWCLVEIFVFLEMGGQLSQLDVRLVDDQCEESGLGSQDMSTLADVIMNFDPAKARCFTDSDTERLHGVLQISGYDRIKQLVCDVFAPHLFPSQKDGNPKHLTLYYKKWSIAGVLKAFD